MYLRETRRRNRDGSEVSYLALAHNERDPDTGVPKARIVHNFGRADLVDRDALARLIKSISRFLDPAEALASTENGEVQILDSRPMGTAWVADRLWQRLGIGTQIAEAAGRRRGPGRRVDPAVVERVIFAMVANRLSPTPLSKLAGCGWVRDRVFIDGLAEVSDDACYRAMDVFLAMLAELQQAVFFSVANLLNLEVDILFFDTSSTYWETESTDDALLDDEHGEEGDEGGRVVERAWRSHGHSKDHRPDLPQVVIGMAVTREGIPVRVWTFPGNTSDQVLIGTVRDDLSDWNLNRVILALDRGFTSAENRRYLQRGGGHYIMGEKLRGDSKEAAAALSRQGRYHTVAGNLRVKEVRVDDGTARDRFVVCHNPDAATRDAAVRDRIVARLAERIAGSDALPATRRAELAGQLRTKAAFSRFLRTTPSGLLRIDRAAVRRDAHFGGKFLLRTQRREPHRRRHRRGLQGPLRSRTRLAGPQVHARPAPRLPPPRGPHPRPRPAAMARPAAPARRRDHRRRHLAQHPRRTRTAAPRHPRHQRRPSRPTQRTHPPPTVDPAGPRTRRATPVLRLHPHRRVATAPGPAA
jgi:hypothetical protein